MQLNRKKKSHFFDRKVTWIQPTMNVATEKCVVWLNAVEVHSQYICLRKDSLTPQI